MKNIVVLVSGNGSNLQALIDACNNGKIENGKINLVISSNHDAYALKRAQNANIKTLTISKNSQSNEEYSKQLLDVLTKNSPDLIVLAGFMHIISQEITDTFKNKIINIHPSLIPSFCGQGYYGLKVHQKALERGVKITGATVHFVDEIADNGPIIIQKSVNIFENDTADILQKRVMEEAEWIILPQAVSWFCSDRIIIKNNKTFIKGI